jgi:hypothetical protein
MIAATRFGVRVGARRGRGNHYMPRMNPRTGNALRAVLLSDLEGPTP